MALQFQVETLDNVPEALRDQYIESDNGYRLNLDGYEDPTNLKSALQKERETAKKYGKQVEQWQRLGKDPDEIAALVAAAEKAEEDKAKNAGEWDKLKGQMNEKHQAELRTRDEQLEGMTKTLESYLVDAQAASAIAEHKGITALLMPHVKNQVKVVNEDGQYAVRVVNDRGEPRIDGNGDYLTIGQLVAEMRQSETFGRAFESTAKPGSGANPGSGPSGRFDGLPKTLAECKTMEEKTAFIRAKQQQNRR